MTYLECPSVTKGKLPSKRWYLATIGLMCVCEYVVMKVKREEDKERTETWTK